MERIDSFNIDHRKLLPGLYVSRRDKVGDGSVTTFDLRLYRPNCGGWMAPEVAHSIEHIIATLLRNDSMFKDCVVYFGPMGCMTGFYLVMKGKLEPEDILPGIEMIFRKGAGLGHIPGLSEKECGNYRFHNLAGAEKEMAEYANILKEISDNNLWSRTVYPRPTMLILTAMGDEESKIRNSLPAFIKEKYSVVFAQTGIGKVNAAMRTQQAIQTLDPDVVLNYGYCGAFVGHSYSKGQGISVDGALYHDVYCGKENNIGQVQRLPMIFPTVTLTDDELDDFLKAGLCESYTKENTSLAAIKENNYILTGDWFIDSKDKANGIRKTFTFNNGHHYGLVDMEAAAIAQVCYLNQVPLIIFKVVSDFVDKHDTTEEHDKEYEGFKENFK